MNTQGALFLVRHWSNDKKICKLGFINGSGEMVIEPKYDRADDFHEDLTIVEQNQKRFVINTSDEKILELPNDIDIWNFSEGLAVMYHNNLYGYMDLTGFHTVPMQYERAEPFRLGLGCVQMKDTKKWGAINKSDKLVIPAKFLNSFSFFGDLAVVQESFDHTGCIDPNGDYAVPPRFKSIGNFSEGLALANDVKTGKTGFIDRTGRYVIQPNLEYANDFSQGFAAIHDKKSKWGYIDAAGNITISTQFNSAGQFSEGLAEVLTNKWGYIDLSGTMKIKPIFTRTRPFQNGAAVVTVGKKHGLIQPNGDYILEPEFEWIHNDSGKELIEAKFQPDRKTPSFSRFYTRDGKLVWSEFKENHSVKSETQSSQKNPKVVVPDLSEVESESVKIINKFSQGNSAVKATITNLEKVSWKNVFLETVNRFDTFWESVYDDSETISGILFFWDDTNGNTGLSVCLSKDPDDPQNDFEGGEPSIDFDFVFAEVISTDVIEEAMDIHKDVQLKLLDPIFEKALSYSIARPAFQKIKRTNPFPIYLAYSHDDERKIILKIGNESKKLPNSSFKD
ncbi:hypothetical protein LEP1GSC060_0864 [Leptospira weilii serovar Ranarum str. ICFT]|uniref:WG repeat-containing protein n=1 Tax=Leptospira weilii serovar Ranarum str. ICFT TaxID=1218598 RepID=N1WJ05_9LEPT|nr:WG repeat-containing protein [Leptospira weilii]EMY78910.1 hypothetical protein LEP1GSC060_0864 [Leptospira weilii serovar Ranarum str. ICFT]